MRDEGDHSLDPHRGQRLPPVKARRPREVRVDAHRHAGQLQRAPQPDRHLDDGVTNLCPEPVSPGAPPPSPPSPASSRRQQWKKWDNAWPPTHRSRSLASKPVSSPGTRGPPPREKPTSSTSGCYRHEWHDVTTASRDGGSHGTSATMSPAANLVAPRASTHIGFQRWRSASAEPLSQPRGRGAHRHQLESTAEIERSVVPTASPS